MTSVGVCRESRGTEGRSTHEMPYLAWRVKIPLALRAVNGYRPAYARIWVAGAVGLGIAQSLFPFQVSHRLKGLDGLRVKIGRLSSRGPAARNAHARAVVRNTLFRRL